MPRPVSKLSTKLVPSRGHAAVGYVFLLVGPMTGLLSQSSSATGPLEGAGPAAAEAPG